ncbi:MAG TPA: enoyl-CoA hydratase-related protein [Vicinamibacterales bacterium]|nr:enoyl-CoA hydratase-related protein [Vicinamibacterales bacterium]
MSHIVITRDEAIGTITIERPARFNSLDVETARDLRCAALQLARDTDIRVVILRGTGGVFCSGADLKYIRAGGAQEDLAYLTPEARAVPAGYGEVFKQILEYIHSTISEIRRAPKPFVAAVDGIAAAGGFGLAMSCDVVLASARSTFEWAYSKTGLTGAESSTFLLPRLIGLRRSLELVLLNPRLYSWRARDLGLVTRVFPDAAFEECVMDIARQLAAGPTKAFGIAKTLMNQAAGIDRLDYHLDQELEQLSRIASEPDFAAGLDAFFQKKEPTFSGR